MGKSLGTLFGSLVIAPATFFIINSLCFRGNQVTQEQVTQYINDSKTIEFLIPYAYDESDEKKVSFEVYRRGLRDLKTIHRFAFFSKEYNRYFVVMNFDGFDYSGAFNSDRNGLERNPVLHRGGYFMVHANNTQWHDINYGAKENPVPIFAFEVSPRSYKTSWVLEDKKKEFDVSDDINRIFVEQYLNYFISDENFKKLFQKQ